LRAFKSTYASALRTSRGVRSARVVAAEQDSAAALAQAIHQASEARGDRLHPASERACIGSLRDQMHVIALNREMRHAKPIPLARFAQGRGGTHTRSCVFAASLRCGGCAA